MKKHQIEYDDSGDDGRASNEKTKGRKTEGMIEI